MNLVFPGGSLYNACLFSDSHHLIELRGVMANTKSARKAARQSEKRRTRNTAIRSELRTAIKNARKAVEAGDKGVAQKVYREAMSVIDRIADKRIIHKNKAARHKSHLASGLKALA
jgi:small subunit ribosomal protein S20